MSVFCFCVSSLNLPLKKLTITIGLNQAVIFRDYVKVQPFKWTENIMSRPHRTRELFDSTVSGGRSHNACQEPVSSTWPEQRRHRLKGGVFLQQSLCNEGFLPRPKQPFNAVDYSVIRARVSSVVKVVWILVHATDKFSTVERTSISSTCHWFFLYVNLQHCSSSVLLFCSVFDICYTVTIFL
jgi:hypothetical protein